MKFLISNWFLIIVAIAIIAVGGYAIYAFIKRPTTEQITKIKEWLLYAVTLAEKELGSGTGQIKLSYVYNMFLTKFPYLSKIISFEYFSNLVDEVLNKFKSILEQNSNLQDYINK
jgi:LPS O-antigen subunit length determinant protein (WzzB/FepE family)